MSGRCVCGRSARFPLCDGSHGDAWSCSGPTSAVGLCIVAGPHLSSLAERLAWEKGGRVLSALEGSVAAAQAIVLSDGTDLAYLRTALERLEAPVVRGLVVDGPAAALGVVLPGAPLASVRPEAPEKLYRAVWDALSGQSTPVEPLRSGFLSHAALDEPWLLPIVEDLRRNAGAELFVCADSIAEGEAWRSRIDEALRSADRFVFVGTPASYASTFCAYEFGMATALGLPRRILRVDATPLPAWIGHLQATDLPRILHHRPWLSRRDALEEALLSFLAS